MATKPAVELLDHLRALCGPEHVTTDPELSVRGLRPRYAVAPATLEEVAAVLNAAREAAATVIPWGGGTQQNIGATPARADLILHTRRLTGIVEWESADLTAGILAGTTLAEVQRTLAAQGQQLAVDAPLSDLATVGGLVATNTTGSRRWRYGGWRDQIIGMHMALADGTSIKSGGRVVKNVQGYDLAKLFTGSLGTLGVIGRVNVKLHPLPQATRLVVANGDLQTVMQCIRDVTDSTLRPSTADVVREPSEGPLRSATYSGLFFFEGSRVSVDAQSFALLRAIEALGLHAHSMDHVSASDVGTGWLSTPGTEPTDHNVALVTIHSTPDHVERVMRDLEHETAPHDVLLGIRSHAGNGIVLAVLDADKGSNWQAIVDIQAALLPRWPAMTLSTVDSRIERAARPWGADPPGLGTMRAVKHAYDPAGILNPGRYVGGI